MEGKVILSECGDCKKYDCKGCLEQPVTTKENIKRRLENIVAMMKIAKAMGKEVLYMQDISSTPFIGG